MKITATAFTINEPIFKFVRGYEDAMTFSITLRNDDPVFDVVTTTSPAVNYNFSIATADSELGE